MNAKGAARLMRLAVSQKEKGWHTLERKLLMARLGSIGADFAIHFGADQTKESRLRLLMRFKPPSTRYFV